MATMGYNPPPLPAGNFLDIGAANGINSDAAFTALQNGMIVVHINRVKLPMVSSIVRYRTTYIEPLASQIYRRDSPGTYPTRATLNAETNRQINSQQTFLDKAVPLIAEVAVAAGFSAAAISVIGGGSAATVAAPADTSIAATAPVTYTSLTDTAITEGLTGTGGATLTDAAVASISAPIATDAAIADVGLGSTASLAAAAEGSSVLSAGVDAITSAGSAVVNTVEAAAVNKLVAPIVAPKKAAAPVVTAAPPSGSGSLSPLLLLAVGLGLKVALFS